MSVEEPIEDPVGYFLEEMTYHGKTDRTRESYERVLREFEGFLASRDTTPDGSERRDCLAWVHQIRGEHADSTVASYASYVNRFYGYMNQIDAVDGNPMGLVMEELPESIDRDPARREVSIPEMQAFTRRIRHPLDQAIVVTLLKTGVRVGELCNLDLRDLSVQDEEVSNAFETLGTRASARERTLFVDSDIARGETVNGEKRRAANKRVRDTQIPVDDELLSILRRWLAIRPSNTTPAEPLFVSTRQAMGDRITPAMVRQIVENHATEAGWYTAGGDASENVTPHYFRHFFTTHLRDRTGDRGVVKYLRGDAAEDIIDTYTHNWGDQVRNRYESSIYSLVVPRYSDK